MIYITTFSISIFFAFFSENLKNRFAKIGMLFLSMLPLLLIGGLKDTTVGADTMAYPFTSFTWAKGYVPISEYLDGEMIEPLYVLIVWFIVHFIGNDFQSVLFFTNAFIVVFFYLGFYRYRKFAPLPYAVFLFCFLFYNNFLSMTRQGMAEALVFWGSSYLVLEKKWIPFVITTVIAFFIHKSAVAALLMVPCIYIHNRKLNNWIVIGVIFVFLAYSTVMKYFVSFDMFDKYEQYQTGEDYEGFFSITEFAIRGVLLTSIVLLIQKGKKDDLYKSIVTIFICEFVFNLFQVYSRFMGRIGYYYYVMYLAMVPHFTWKIGKKKWKGLSLFVIVATSIAIWWWVYIENQSANTYPYVSKILGIQ